MKKLWALLLAGVLIMSTAACSSDTEPAPESVDESSVSLAVEKPAEESTVETEEDDGTVHIIAAEDGSIEWNAPQDGSDPVHLSHDIIYYEEGHDFTYGEGGAGDEHSADEAAMHTVINITEPGSYVLSGKVELGQVAIDLGEDAKEDPGAVVTLILDNFDITCTVAPAIIFYNVYECGSTDEGTADVDTSSAGANVILRDGSINNVVGSYVARIYKEFTLSEDGTEVVDSKKLHKYDGAFYSKMSMNISGEDESSGVLNIEAENEGLDSELHLTINGGNINITAGNDGINTNEDNISVTTVNGGKLNIICSGGTGEGDGIDSNGWLVINGGEVTAQGCAVSGDAGIDSDMGIHLNGGTVIATGNMQDSIADSEANYAVFMFAEKVSGNFALKDAAGETVTEFSADNEFTCLVLSVPQLTAGEYSLWQGETRLAHGGNGENRGMGGMGMTPPEGAPEDGGEFGTPPEGAPEDGREFGTPPEGVPEGGREFGTPPEGVPEGGGTFPGNDTAAPGEMSNIFSISEGGNHFSGITSDEQT